VRWGPCVRPLTGTTPLWHAEEDSVLTTSVKPLRVSRNSNPVDPQTSRSLSAKFVYCSTAIRFQGRLSLKIEAALVQRTVATSARCIRRHTESGIFVVSEAGAMPAEACQRGLGTDGASVLLESQGLGPSNV